MKMRNTNDLVVSSFSSSVGSWMHLALLLTALLLPTTSGRLLAVVVGVWVLNDVAHPPVGFLCSSVTS